MPLFRPSSELDRVFMWSIMAKAIDGACEMIGGVLLLVVAPARITRWARSITQHELGTDPNDFVARQVLRSAHDFASGGRTLPPCICWFTG